MTSPRNLTDPFDLLDTDTKVAPILPKSKLDGMIDRALTLPQIEAPARRPAPFLEGRKGWWSGGLATAACMILLLTLFPLNQTMVKRTLPATHTATATATTGKTGSQIQEDATEISNMMIYDSLEGY